MLDQLRHQIQTRLDELLGEADMLRRALAALGSRDRAASASGSAAPSPTPDRARRRARQAKASRTATRKPARSRASAGPPRTAARTAPGATRSAVLQALAGGDAMTAGEVASATGLGSATVSTTLSRLATAAR
jgi:DNA-binding transcriptional ArsR family regulator